jgi:hypothetical protein
MAPHHPGNRRNGYRFPGAHHWRIFNDRTSHQPRLPAQNEDGANVTRPPWAGVCSRRQLVPVGVLSRTRVHLQIVYETRRRLRGCSDTHNVDHHHGDRVDRSPPMGLVEGEDSRGAHATAYGRQRLRAREPLQDPSRRVVPFGRRRGRLPDFHDLAEGPQPPQPASRTGGLDTIRLTATPEPPSISIALPGASLRHFLRTYASTTASTKTSYSFLC